MLKSRGVGVDLNHKILEEFLGVLKGWFERIKSDLEALFKSLISSPLIISSDSLTNGI
jgi:hypothetical protein